MILRVAVALVGATGLGACSDATAPILPGPGTVQATVTLDGITFRAATTLLRGSEVRVTLEAQNATAEAQQTGILGGNCMIRLRGYTDEARSGAPVFGPPLDEACQEPLRIFELQPGGTDVIEQSFVVDASSDVMYFFTVEFQHTQRHELTAGMGLLGR